jgi:hypothetical protein
MQEKKCPIIERHPDGGQRTLEGPGEAGAQVRKGEKAAFVVNTASP